MAYHCPAATRCISPVWGAKLLSRSRTLSYQKSVCTISHLPPLWQTPLCSKAILVKQSMDTLSSAKPYLPARCAGDLYVAVVIRDVLCASVFVARWGLGDSMNKQKADNLSDVTPWPHFIFRTPVPPPPFFLQLLGKVVSLSHEMLHVSSKRFSCCDAQIAMCVWKTRYHVQPCLWHSHLRSNRGGAGRGFFSISLYFCHPDCRLFGTVSTQMDKLSIFFSQGLKRHSGTEPGCAHESPTACLFLLLFKNRK